MPNYKFVVTFCILSLLEIVLNKSASAQSEDRKFEVGAQISGLAGGSSSSNGTVGGGGRLTYNITKNLAVEGELNYLTSNRFDNLRRIQGQFGVKSGLRFNRFGVFGKVRPGFIDTSQDFVIFLQTPCVPALGTPCVQSIFPISGSDSDTGFSLDLGAVAELYPSKRLVVRLDLGDTILTRQRLALFIDNPVLIGQTTPGFAIGNFISIPGRSFATHNLQLSVGVGFRF